MSVSVEQREQTVSAAIREISHIATLPEITLKIIELVESPKSTAQDLHQVISNDPALCSRILKVVNSSFYGLPGQIGSINRAIVLLGLNAVKNIAIAASLAKLFRGGDLTPNFSARHLWAHSNVVAAASKMICDKLKLGFGDEAFLGGLMHDIGIMVEMQYDRNKLIEVIEQLGADSAGVPVQNMLEVEESVFGANHQHFGAGLCDKWKFPKTFSRVCGFHHHPLDLNAEHRTLACIINLADRLAGRVGEKFRLDLVSLDVDSGVKDVLKLNDEAIRGLTEQLEQHLKTAGDLLG
ncbi:MAG: HDOD domain-containing protein [Phycisphaerales bacterium]|jgi:putative nucleotidyltransferase with HDIG domain|nr:HDOD domain-containing protein [Phycisphaerales bacterium]